jgi:hypothetical protein
VIRRGQYQESGPAGAELKPAAVPPVDAGEKLASLAGS